MSNHITEQPLHKTIRQYRVVAISGIILLGIMVMFGLNPKDLFTK